MESGFLTLWVISAHISGQMLTFEGYTCSHFRAFTKGREEVRKVTGSEIWETFTGSGL
jgi:hypothetical protein